MQEQKFSVGQEVKSKDDSPKAKPGKILSFTFSPEEGYIYKISSSYFDAEVGDMVTGHKMCREDELVLFTTAPSEEGATQ